MKGYREKDVVSNARNAVAKDLEFIEKGKSIFLKIFHVVPDSDVEKNQEVCIIFIQK